MGRRMARTEAIARASSALHKSTLIDKSDLDVCAAMTVSAALDPDDEHLRRAVIVGMNSECPPGQGITERGAELALIALRNVFANASPSTEGA